MAALEFPPRVVTLVLCRGDGTVVGALEPFEAAMPYWQNARELTAVARARYGIDATILRLLQAGPSPSAGPVTYLAQFDGPTPAAVSTWAGDPNAPEPLRLPYAQPGGPRADLDWAREALGARGITMSGAPEQMRTWNLSAIWRIPTAAGDVWLKSVPPFLAHEGPLMLQLDPAAIPEMLATDGGRTLLRDVPGQDHYQADLPLLLRLVQRLHELQVAQAGRIEQLLRIGLPDWRADGLGRWVARVIDQAGGELDRDDRAALDSLLGTWSRRFAALSECGVPDSLVHGDLHSGNSRGEGDRLVILDWGDSGVGHPLLDQTALLNEVAPDDAAAVRAQWSKLWRASIPGCDPERAMTLLEPVAAIRHAAVYQNFLDRIEPDERIYHVHDPLDWLRRTAAIIRRSAAPACPDKV